MKKTLKIMSPLLVICAGVGVYALLHAAKPEPEKKHEPPRLVSVFVEPVKRNNVALDVITQGEVRPATEIDMFSQVGGRVVEVSSEFTEGGTVKPGIALLVIEDIDYRLALSQAEARVAEADVGVQKAIASADVARKQLRNQSHVSPLALKKPQVAEARARLKAADADLEQARLNLSRTRISLPFHGRITRTFVDVGQYISAGTMLGKAFAIDAVEIRLPITDSQLASLGLPIGYVAPQKGGPSVSFSATVAGREQRWHGRLVRLDASIDPRTRMLYGTAEVLDPYDRGVSQHRMPLAVGLYVKAVIAGREVPDAYVIPRHALRVGDAVYVVNNQGFLDIRKVGVLHTSPQQAVIVNGLSLGERVIISSIRNPIAGMALQAMSRVEGQVVAEGKPVMDTESKITETAAAVEG